MRLRDAGLMPGTAFTPRAEAPVRVKVDFSIHVRDDEANPGYYFYKQVSRAGPPGMAVAHAGSMGSEVSLLAFSNNGASSPNAFCGNQCFR